MNVKAAEQEKPKVVMVLDSYQAGTTIKAKVEGVDADKIVSYQWYRSLMAEGARNQDIEDATQDSYTTKEDDIKYMIGVKVTIQGMDDLLWGGTRHEIIPKREWYTLDLVTDESQVKVDFEEKEGYMAMLIGRCLFTEEELNAILESGKTPWAICGYKNEKTGKYRAVYYSNEWWSSDFSFEMEGIEDCVVYVIHEVDCSTLEDEKDKNPEEKEDSKPEQKPEQQPTLTPDAGTQQKEVVENGSREIQVTGDTHVTLKGDEKSTSRRR